MGNFNGKGDYHYQTMRCNIDLLKVIQIGITVFTPDGDPPPAVMSAAELGLDTTQDDTRKYTNAAIQIPQTWQFNFKFSLEEDMYSEVSIESLRISGVDFSRLDSEGIEPDAFGSLLMSSGFVCDEDVYWISFHTGYDFGYLMKLLLINELPNDESEFSRYLTKFFPSVLDIKYLMKYAIGQHKMGHATPLDAASADVLTKFEQKSTLENLADALKIKRTGPAHQAGSESLLNGRVFFKVQERIFNGEVAEELVGKVWGFGSSESSMPSANAHIHSTPQNYGQMQENVTPNQNGYSNGAPSTPNTGNAGLVSTPQHNTNGGGMGPQTPSGMGGVFGAFSYNNK